MSLWTRIVNVARGDRLNREIDDELASHIEEAIEQGRDPAEARRALGSPLRLREASRDVKLVAWLDSLRADAVFGWRQLKKDRVTSGAAILSLALGIGASVSAFRLIDAVLLRPLPVSEPERLYLLGFQGFGPDGKARTSDGCEYPLFRELRAAAKGQAELIAVSYVGQADLSYGSYQETEKAYRQFVSGWMFASFGLRPALGRLLDEGDDLEPGTRPYAVISHDYWTRRFGRDPSVVGRTFRMGEALYEIVGVAERRFTGTEPGTVTDVFLPTMMNAGVLHDDWSWIRTFVRPGPNVAAESVRDRLDAPFRAYRQERAKGFAGDKVRITRFLADRIVLEPASAGVSGMQKDYRPALVALALLVATVLLIACANVASLMTARAAGRARELALRVSIGAGRGRLVQLVVVESAWLAFLAAALGALFAGWSVPFVVGMMSPPNDPARLVLPADWRVLGFGLALAAGVTFLFGLTPALNASAVRPVSALKGGEDPHSRRRVLHALVAAQAAFCFFVLFLGSLFVATFERLAHQPTGYSAERLLALDTVARGAPSTAIWNEVAEHLRTLPDVETVALAGWALLDGNGWNGLVSIDGAPPGPSLAYFLRVSPGWAGTMKVPLLAGEDFRPSDVGHGVAIVNAAFAREYFGGQDPVGKGFDKTDLSGARVHFRIVGLVGDARYRNMREPLTPTAYVPFESTDRGTFLVRTTAPNPLALASLLRQEVSRARPEFRVSNVRTQTALDQSHTVRERLLATLAAFFAVVALLLAGIGLYAVLHYSVLQRRREIGIRMAIGARGPGIARLVTASALAMVLVGAVVGLGLGMLSVRCIETLLYGVEATEPAMLAVPSLALAAVVLLAALPPVIRAVRIDPMKTLRAE